MNDAAMTLHFTHIFNQLYENTFFLLILLGVSGNMNKRNLRVQRVKTENNITYDTVILILLMKIYKYNLSIGIRVYSKSKNTIYHALTTQKLTDMTRSNCSTTISLHVRVLGQTPGNSSIDIIQPSK